MTKTLTRPMSSRRVHDVFDQLTEQILGEVVENFGRSGTQWAQGSWTPAYDIIESRDDYQVQCEVPGLTRDDISLAIDGGTLNIFGSYKESNVETRYLVRNRPSGSFELRLQFPGSINTENVKATVQNGVLLVTLPRLTSARAREIPIS